MNSQTRRKMANPEYAKSLDEIGASLTQVARELSPADRVRLTEALWVALSMPVGGLAQGLLHHLHYKLPTIRE